MQNLSARGAAEQRPGLPHPRPTLTHLVAPSPSHPIYGRGAWRARSLPGCDLPLCTASSAYQLPVDSQASTTRPAPYMGGPAARRAQMMTAQSRAPGAQRRASQTCGQRARLSTGGVHTCAEPFPHGVGIRWEIAGGQLVRSRHISRIGRDRNQRANSPLLSYGHLNRLYYYDYFYYRKDCQGSFSTSCAGKRAIPR